MKTVFTPKSFDRIRSALESLRGKIHDRTKLVLTAEEVVSAYVLKEHVDLMNRVKELTGGIGSSQIFATAIKGSRITLPTVQFHFNGSGPTLMPAYCREGVSAECPEAVRIKLSDWADERYRIGCAFGDTYEIIEHLNQICGDMKSMALLFPCITTLMVATGSTGNGSDKSADNKLAKAAGVVHNKTSFAGLPRLDRATKERMLDVSSVINSMTLIKDAPEVKWPYGSAVVGATVGYPEHPPVFFDQSERGKFF